MTPIGTSEAAARHLRLARALESIDAAIARLDLRADISGLERLRADIAAALRLADAAAA
jgi:hypothetical protein